MDVRPKQHEVSEERELLIDIAALAATFRCLSPGRRGELLRQAIRLLDAEGRDGVPRERDRLATGQPQVLA